MKSHFIESIIPNKKYLTTYTGRKVDPIKISNDTINNITIEDIAHSLSMKVRFNGHLKTFYSIAEHSLNCSLMVSEMPSFEPNRTPEIRLEALLHDAAEAYLADVPSPIKYAFNGFRSVEQNVLYCIQRAICPIGVNLTDFQISNAVKEVDKYTLMLEAKELLREIPEWYHECNKDFLQKASKDTLLYCDYEIQKAKELFIERYEQLTKEIMAKRSS